MYNLVPPKSKIVEYESPYLKDVKFKVKVFDFEEDDKFQRLLFDNIETSENGELLKDENGHYLLKEEQYYIDCFKMLVPEIIGITGTFSPSWSVIKSVVNYGKSINSVTELEK